MTRFRREERFEEHPTPVRDGVSRGKRLFDNPELAALALLRGYRVGGVYDHPLEGAARELGYYPLSDATDEEWEEINRILSSQGDD